MSSSAAHVSTGSFYPAAPGEGGPSASTSPEPLVCLPGLRIIRSPHERAAHLVLDADAPAALEEAIERCIEVRQRVGGFAGLVVFRADMEPGVYAIHTQLSGHVGQVVRDGWGLGRRLELFVRVARAVQGLHEIGEYAQVLSPQHVLLNAGSSPHVLAPGIVVPTTEPYQAPESRDQGCCDVLSDVYCLGALLHFLLTGNEPWEADRELTTIAPVGLRRIVRKALSVERGERYESVYALVQDLSRHTQVERVGVGHPADHTDRVEKSGPLPLGTLSPPAHLDDEPVAAE